MLISLSALPASAQTPEAPGNAEAQYEDVSMDLLSKLYWALDRNKLEDDRHVGNFLMFNDCQIFRDYAHNEFEWKQILNAVRKDIEKNMDKFGTQMRVVQPLRFADYNFDKQGFELWEEYNVDGIRRFEIYAKDVDDEICGQDYFREIYGYPRGIVAEFGRALDLEIVPLSPEKAERFIAQKTPEFETLPHYQRSKKALFESRDAYLVMNMKALSYKGDQKTQEGFLLSRFLMTLESLEIYADKGLTQLLYKQDFKKTRRISKREEELKKKYQERLKRHREKMDMNAKKLKNNI